MLGSVGGVQLAEDLRSALLQGRVVAVEGVVTSDWARFMWAVSLLPLQSMLLSAARISFCLARPSWMICRHSEISSLGWWPLPLPPPPPLLPVLLLTRVESKVEEDEVEVLLMPLVAAEVMDRPRKELSRPWISCKRKKKFVRCERERDAVSKNLYEWI